MLIHLPTDAPSRMLYFRPTGKKQRGVQGQRVPRATCLSTAIGIVVEL